MKKQLKSLVTAFLISLLIVSCNYNNRFNIDTSENNVVVKIHRFDSALISYDSTDNKCLSKLNSKFSDFLPVYTSEIINTNLNDSATVKKEFKQFLSDSIFAKVNKKTMETFGDVSDIEKTVSEAFTYIHHYFPKVILPEIYFYVSGFNRAAILNNKFIGIGTDYYLGNDYARYKDFTYDYLIYNMRRECVATDIVSATLFRIFPMNNSQDRLLDNMLYRGRIMYLLSVFMPNEKSENIMGYQIEKWNWCKTNEKAIWTAVIDQKDLFSTDMLLIRKYMDDAPFTSPISQKSPGRLGTWLGWQIVDSYMKKNKNLSLVDLMNETNSQKILEESGYRP